MENLLEDKKTDIAVCHHCGEDCTDEIIKFEEHNFCCSGCQTVYQMLTANGLTDFYQLSERPSLDLKKSRSISKFEYLEHPDIQQRFITFTDGKQTHTGFYLPKIHCTSCLWLLEKLPWLHEGILQSKVNYLKKEVFIAFDSEKISLRGVAELLSTLGYPPHITSAQEDKKKPKFNKSIIYKLGVTGFCAGNIMLMSFPEYLGYDDISQFWRNIFGWLSMILSIPVLVWSAKDYWYSAYQAIRNRGVNIDVPITLGILALFGRSTYEVISQTGAGYFDSFVALIFFLLIGKWVQDRTFAHISFERDYKSYFPIAVTRLKVGNDDSSSPPEESCPIEQLKKGDEILVRNGELIPADAILLEGNAQIDYSFITGETEPVERKIGELIYAGGRQQGSLLKLSLEKNVSQSYLTQLWNAETFQKNQSEATKNLTDKLSFNFTIAVLLIALVSGVYWSFSDVGKAFNVVTAVLIVACPCALALNVPFTLGNALRILGKMGLYVKNTTVIEQLPNISHIVFDKTGTITEGNQIQFEGQVLSENEKAGILALARCSAHPMSKRIAELLQAEGVKTQLDAEEVNEAIGSGIEGWVGKVFFRLGKASFVGEKPEDRSKQATGARSFVSINGEIKGFFKWDQQLREGSAELIETLSKKHQLALVSGDRSTEVEKIAEIFPPSATSQFEQSPAQKMDYIEHLQAKKQQVMMLGDGLNDAGALKQANVGIAISDDTHQFSPSSDAILLGQKMPLLPSFLSFAQSAMNVVKMGYIFSIMYNLIGLFFAVQGLLEPVIAAVLMPISSVSVVGWGYIATNWLGKKLEQNKS